jgi:hypothetical protein
MSDRIIQVNILAIVLRDQNGPCGVGNLPVCLGFKPEGRRVVSNNFHKEIFY